MNFLKLLPLLLLAACQPPSAASEEPPLAGARIGGPFNLVDETGRAVTEKEYAGRYRMIYFGYTFCPDVCPVDVANLMQGFRQFEKMQPSAAAKVQPLFVSVDPARDTPEILKTFTDNFHPRLIGLTGSAEQVANAAKAHAIYVRKQGDAKATDYLVDHSNVTYLMGPDGAPIAPVPQDKEADEIAATLAKWVK